MTYQVSGLPLKSTSKTFEKDSDVGELLHWFFSKLQTEEKEYPQSGSEPSLDVIVETKHKYKITIEIK